MVVIIFPCFSHPSSDGVMSARKLCENLIDHVRTCIYMYMYNLILITCTCTCIG